MLTILIRFLLLLGSLASIHKIFIHQMDVKTNFLNGDFEKEIYMLQPKGCIILGKENKVCKLHKFYIV